MANDKKIRLTPDSVKQVPGLAVRTNIKAGIKTGIKF
jgi:hypothetical protein